MDRWNEEAIHQVYDSVLVGSITELREALELLERNDVPSDSRYVRQIREGLRVMESELDRRGLHVARGARHGEPAWKQPRSSTSA